MLPKSNNCKKTPKIKLKQPKEGGAITYRSFGVCLGCDLGVFKGLVPLGVLPVDACIHVLKLQYTCSASVKAVQHMACVSWSSNQCAGGGQLGADWTRHHRASQGTTRPRGSMRHQRAARWPQVSNLHHIIQQPAPWHLRLVGLEQPHPTGGQPPKTSHQLPTTNYQPPGQGAGVCSSPHRGLGPPHSAGQGDRCSAWGIMR